MEERSENNNSRILIIVILLACAAAFLVAGYKLSHSLMEYEAANVEYGKVSEKYVKVREKGTAVKTVFSEETEEEEKESPWTEDQSIPDMTVDYDALKAENADYSCWLYLPATGISYPVVRGEDNDFYLHHTFEKEKNVNGCIYIDSRSWTDLMDYNTYIFGHNMRNGSMFGSLKQMLNDPEIAVSDPWFYLIMKDEVWKYHIYSLHVTPPNSSYFHNPASKAEYADYISMALKDSVADMKEEVDTDDKTITLSTCSGTGAGKKRLVVHGKLAGIIKTDGSVSVSYNYAKPAVTNETSETK